MTRILFIAMLFCVVLPGCVDLGDPLSDGSAQIDETVNGMTLSYRSNQKITLRLESWADAGYRWDYTLTDSSVAYIDGALTYRPNNPGVVGGVATATAVICTRRPGNCELLFFEHQPWLTNAPRRKSVSFTVVVRE